MREATILCVNGNPYRAAKCTADDGTYALHSSLEFAQYIAAFFAPQKYQKVRDEVSA